MSQIFTMLLGTNVYNEASSVIAHVVDKNLSMVKMFGGNFNSVRDNQGNNLLHLATLGESCDIISFLLDRGVDKNFKNKFDCTPWDYAIRSHNKELLNVFMRRDSMYVNTLAVDNSRFKGMNTDLVDKNMKLTIDKEMYMKETVILKQNNKRLRDQNDDLTQRVVKLTSENYEHVESIKKLKTSVDSLTKAMRK